MGRLGRAGRTAALALAAGIAASAPAVPGVDGPAPLATPASSASSGPAADPPGSAPSEGSRAVAEVYRRRSWALATGNRPAWESTVADPASETGRRQLSQYDALRALGVTELTVREVRPAAAASASGGDDLPSSLTAVVRLGHRIPGFDREPREAARTLTLRLGAGRWEVVGDGAAEDRLQVWDLDGLQVRRADTVLVAGNADSGVLAERLAAAQAGQDQVRDVLGDAEPAVVVVPRTAEETARQLGRPAGQPWAQVAATTDGSGAETRADRVVVAPDAFLALTDEGRRVVLAHELAHVAVRARMPGRVPLWLSEGLAEYVAWKPVQMPVEVAAARLLDRVRSAGAPGALPADGDFDPARGDAATAYQAAWLAVRFLADEHGEGRVLALHRAVARTSGTQPLGAAVERAFVDELGTSLDRFEASWRARLEQLAR